MASLFKFVITLCNHGKNTQTRALFTENDASAERILNYLELHYVIEDISDIKRSTKSYRVLLQTKTTSVEVSGVLATSLQEFISGHIPERFRPNVKDIVDGVLANNTKVLHEVDDKKTGMLVIRITEEGPVTNLINNL